VNRLYMGRLNTRDLTSRDHVTKVDIERFVSVFEWASSDAVSYYMVSRCQVSRFQRSSIDTKSANFITKDQRPPNAPDLNRLNGICLRQQCRIFFGKRMVQNAFHH